MAYGLGPAKTLETTVDHGRSFFDIFPIMSHCVNRVLAGLQIAACYGTVNGKNKLLHQLSAADVYAQISHQKLAQSCVKTCQNA